MDSDGRDNNYPGMRRASTGATCDLQPATCPAASTHPLAGRSHYDCVAAGGLKRSLSGLPVVDVVRV
jgi:hypothetical protein